VLSSLTIEELVDGYALILDEIFGVYASFQCRELSVSMEPGKPKSY